MTKRTGTAAPSKAATKQEATKAEALRAKAAAILAQADKADAADVGASLRAKVAGWVASSKRLVAAAKELGGFTVNADGSVVEPKSGSTGTKSPSALKAAGCIDIIVNGKPINARTASKAMAAVRGIDAKNSKAIKALYGVDSSARVAGMPYYRDLFAKAKVMVACQDGTSKPINEVIEAEDGIPPDIR